MKIKVYADPGHAWARVPFKLLYKLGIQDKITRYSYMRRGYAYLEEDCDLSTLIKALQEKGIEFSFDEKHTNKRSKIRSYLSYNLGA